jgi:RIIB protector from prophage-induced early lysis
MKILTSSFNMNPPRLSVTYFDDNNKLKQFGADSIQIEKYVKESEYKTLDSLVNDFINDKDNTFTKFLLHFRRKDKDEIQSIVDKVDEEIDITKVAPTLQNFIIKITNDINVDDNVVLAWTKFARKLQRNVDPYIRSQLFNFLNYLIDTENSLALTPEGNFIGYKGIQKNYLSSRAGNGFVDGVEYKNTQIPNKPGTVVSMNRHEVQADPDQTCSFGLHVGSYSYAKGFQPLVVLVEVNPENVVSVPSDYNGQKLRCSEYKVIKEVDKPLTEFLYEEKQTSLTDLKDEDFFSEIEEDTNKTSLTNLDDNDSFFSESNGTDLTSLSDDNNFFSEQNEKENLLIELSDDEDLFNEKDIDIENKTTPRKPKSSRYSGNKYTI